MKRSMVLDEERFEARFLRCALCAVRFSQENMPRLLPCHHSFCQPCCDALYAEALDKPSVPSSYSSRLQHTLALSPGSASITCPTCRSVVIVNADNIRQLPADHRVVQLMDFARGQDRVTVTFCSDHSLQPLNFFCASCLRPVCRACPCVAAPACDVTDLQAAMMEHQPTLEQAIADMEAEAAGIQDKVACLTRVTGLVEGVRGQLLEQVRGVCGRLRAALDERERALVERVHAETEAERDKLAAKSETLVARRQFLTSQAERLSAARADNDVQEMFRVHREVRDFRGATPARIREVDDGLMTSFALNVREESILTSRIKNFADVSTKVETTSARNVVATNPTASVLYRSSSTR